MIMAETDYDTEELLSDGKAAKACRDFWLWIPDLSNLTPLPIPTHPRGGIWQEDRSVACPLF